VQDIDTRQPLEIDMTHSRFITTLTTRLQALASALVVTVAMLGGINGIATAEVAAAQSAAAHMLEA
jgi:hypothetical protein